MEAILPAAQKAVISILEIATILHLAAFGVASPFQT
jgi:hypothetical protein